MNATTLPALGAIHHLRLTVSDIDRARAFYTDVLGFNVAMELPPGVLLSNGSVLLGLRLTEDPVRAGGADRFDENRSGLDHLSFGVRNRDELEQASRTFDERGVPHGEIRDLGPDLDIYVMAFRDPDNIQLELTAPRDVG